jgi:hypothetical protein
MVGTSNNRSASFFAWWPSWTWCWEKLFFDLRKYLASEVKLVSLMHELYCEFIGITDSGCVLGGGVCVHIQNERE